MLCQNRRVPRALFSVYDKSGVVDFARSLHELGWGLLASGGTAQVLRAAALPVVDIADVTGYPAILGHRVVTLHPAVHGGILADTNDPTHREDLSRHDIEPIDLVCVGLYPFASEPGVDLIDIGGPSLVRGAAKNHARVAVVTDSSQYGPIVAELREHGELTAGTRRDLAARAFAVTAAYDARVAAWFAEEHATSEAGDGSLPNYVTLRLERESPLRYGENPHQRGARYRIVGQRSWWSDAEQLAGKELSYLNVLDADAAWSLVNQFSAPAAVVIKHANPCGLAVADDIESAYTRAHDCDPLSAFGGIVGLNRAMTEATADALLETFTEVVVAPEFESGALEKLRTKKNLRVMRARAPFGDGWSLRGVDGSVLLQDRDKPSADTSQWRVVGNTTPTDAQWRDAAIAWVTCAAVSSNAIVLVRDAMAVGIGAGQQNRVGSARLACQRAGERARGSVAASDAFFPFRDGPEVLAAAGVSMIVQPGGSQRDDESITAADEFGIAMVFTGTRHFRH